VAATRAPEDTAVRGDVSTVGDVEVGERGRVQLRDHERHRVGNEHDGADARGDPTTPANQRLPIHAQQREQRDEQAPEGVWRGLVLVSQHQRQQRDRPPVPPGAAPGRARRQHVDEAEEVPSLEPAPAPRRRPTPRAAATRAAGGASAPRSRDPPTSPRRGTARRGRRLSPLGLDASAPRAPRSHGAHGAHGDELIAAAEAHPPELPVARSSRQSRFRFPRA
jgi:hypothetical protein